MTTTTSTTGPGLVRPTDAEVVALDPVVRLARTIRQQAGELDRTAVQGIVAAYYQFQGHRIAFKAQARAQADHQRPDDIPLHFFHQSKVLETQARAILGEWAGTFPAGQWMQRQYGVGPVISAGLLAHLDVHRAPSAGHFWSFAGSNPDRKWNKGERRPWNADLKRLCWLLADSFVKFRNNTDPETGEWLCFYGRHYQAKKEQLIERNNRGGFAELATRTLEERKIRDPETVAIYEAERIPDGRVDAQARRWTWKLFLCHLHTRLCEQEGITPPDPYVITYLKHVHRIEIPA